MLRTRIRTLLAWVALSALALIAAPVVAQDPGQVTTTIILGYDLDGLAAADNVIFADTNVVDSTSYTIAAQPDTCRALIATITDADASMVAGTFTVTGTDGNGLRQSTTFVATGGSATRTISGTWCSIATVSSGVITGETAGTDKIRVGTTGVAPLQYTVAQGYVRAPGLGEVSAGVKIENPSDIFQPNSVLSWQSFGDPTTEAARRIKTGTTATTSVTSFTASSGAFTGLVVGDVLVFNDASDNPIQAAVVTITDVNNIVLDRAVLLTKTLGHTYQYRRKIVRSGSESGWFTVAGYKQYTVTIDVQAMTGTGGISYTVECKPRRSIGFVTVKALTNIAAASVVKEDITTAYDVCRVGMQWVTGDDADATPAAEERVNVYMTGRR